MNFGKYIPITTSAITATSGLFLIMHSLIARPELLIEDREPPRFIEYIQVLPPTTIKLIDREVPKPVEAEDRPDPVEPEHNIDGDDFTPVPQPKPRQPHLSPQNPQFDNLADGAQIPLVRIQANYPRRALERGITGWALVAFRITPSGTVEDPEIIEAEPAGYFEKETLKVIKKFKYKPKVVNGQTVESFGQFRMVFNLE